MPSENRKPIDAVWRPVRDLPSECRDWTHAGAREAARRWAAARHKLENPDIDRSLMDVWLKEQKRAFAIETGQIEGLYRLPAGITETLITEGFESVRGTHSVTAIDDATLKGLLVDQEAALEMVFATVKNERPMSNHVIKEWHALMTRHQETAAGIDPFGNRKQIPLRRGDYKVRPNNPRRPDGVVHEYCPPEQVQSEMDRFLEFHRGHEDLAPEVEAAWLHHEFVRIHPFQDGNGRVSRLLMAYPYIKAGEFPPVIHADDKPAYLAALQLADKGNFRAFVDYLGIRGELRCSDATLRAEQVFSGDQVMLHANGGVTNKGVYYPPEPQPGEGQEPVLGRNRNDPDDPFAIPDPSRPPRPW
ncbi:MAG: Fic family protein [Paracoccaceae bacterium]|nr:Fic family protein [Paracoccaceae bacterium]